MRVRPARCFRSACSRFRLSLLLPQMFSNGVDNLYIPSMRSDLVARVERIFNGRPLIVDTA